MKRLHFAFALALLSARPAIPQQPQDASGPSMQETAQWIVNNFAKSGGRYIVPAPDHYVTESNNVRAGVDSCTLTYSANVTIHYPDIAARVFGHSSDTYLDTWTIPLGSIQFVDRNDRAWPGAGTILESAYVRIVSNTSSFTETIINASSHANKYDGPKEGRYSQNEAVFAFNIQGEDNEDLVPRMVEALTHARDLCKASYNPHPGEPF